MRAQRHPVLRSGVVALLCLGVLSLHLALLSRLWPLPARAGASGTAVLQIRTIAAPPAAVAEAALPPAVAPATAVRTRVPAAAAPPAAAAAARPSGEAPWPVYATRLPAAAELHYRVQRGDSVGSARLQWEPGDAGYLLRLDTQWPGQPPRGAASRGLIDGDGVAPLRHTELQRAREVRAANFQREAGRITFSGPQLAYELRPGAQDRLSWLIQLPAILQADAALARPGKSVQIFVVGTRGDAEPWRFELQGEEALDLPVGTVPQALHLRREPTRPYDTRVEVWLDPAREHLPVRVVFTTVPGGAPLQMELADALEFGGAAPR